MWPLVFLPFAANSALMAVDEFYFHMRRGLPRWERIGHPLDTLTVLACFVFVLVQPFSRNAFYAYIGLAAFSALFVTKDEKVHTEVCTAAENWTHACLFSLHPLVLASTGIVWFLLSADPGHPIARFLNADESTHGIFAAFLMAQAVVASAGLVWQSVYWNLIWAEK